MLIHPAWLLYSLKHNRNFHQLSLKGEPNSSCMTSSATSQIQDTRVVPHPIPLSHTLCPWSGLLVHTLRPGSTWAMVGLWGDWPPALWASETDHQYLLGAITTTLTSVSPSPRSLWLINCPSFSLNLPRSRFLLLLMGLSRHVCEGGELGDKYRQKDQETVRGKRTIYVG